MNRSAQLSSSTQKKIAIFILLVVAVIAAAWFFTKASAGTDAVRIGKVAKEDLIQRTTIAGIAEANKTTNVGAPYDGYVKKLYVKLTDKIQAGDPVVSIAQSLQASENVFPIRAPFSGIVTQVQKSEGQFAKTGDSKDYIVRLDDLSQMFVNANAPEMDVVKLKPGLEAVIRVSAVQSHTYSGIVESISKAASSNESWGGRSQVNFSVKIKVTDPDPMLMPGMSSIVDIVTNKKPGVLTLPHEFIQKDGEQYFVIDKSGKRINIKVGAQNEAAFEITEGLREGQEIQQIDFLKLIEKEAEP